MQTLILTGSVAYDFVFDIPDPFSKYILPEKIHNINISIVTEVFERSFGGTGGNQAFYFARLGQSPKLLASGGYDFSDYKKFLAKNKIATNYILISKKLPTAAGFVMADPKDNQIWAFSKGAMVEARKLSLKKITNSRSYPFVLISPNDFTAMENYVRYCVKNRISFAFDPAFYIPHLDEDVLLLGVKNARVIFGNDYEIAFIEKKIQKKLRDVLQPYQILVETLGDKGSQILQNKKEIKIGIYKTKLVDPTGAGDAYRAGFLFGYLRGKPLKVCGWMGAVVSSFAVEVKGTMNLQFTKKKFEKRLAKIKTLTVQ